MEIGLLLVHVTVGLLVAGHGWLKVTDLDGMGSYVESVGLRPGRPLALVAGATELVGGGLLALGLLTPVGAALVAATMLVAARTDHRGKGLWIFNGGAELVLTNAAVALGLAFNGAGDWSLDSAVGWDAAGLWWGVGAAAAAVAGATAVLVRFRRAPNAAAQAA